MQRILLVVMCLAATALPAYAQALAQAVQDSVTAAIAAVRAERRVDVLNAACHEFRRTDAAIAKQYGQQALKLAESLHYENGHAEALRCLGVVDYLQGNYADAHAKCKEASAIFQTTQYVPGQADAHSSLGVLHRLQENYAMALDHFTQALALRTKLNDPKGMAAIQGNIGTTYYRMGDYPKALAAHEAALKLNREAKYAAGILNDYGNIGVVQFARGNYTAAAEYFKNFLQMERTVPDRHGRAEALGNLGMISYKRGQYNEAINYALRSQVVAPAIGGTNILKENSLTLAESYAANRNYAKAYEFYRQYATLKDSLQRNEGTRRVKALEARLRDNEQALQQQQGQLEQRENTTILTTAVAGLLLVLNVIWLIAYWRKRKA